MTAEDVLNSKFLYAWVRTGTSSYRSIVVPRPVAGVFDCEDRVLWAVLYPHKGTYPDPVVWGYMLDGDGIRFRTMEEAEAALDAKAVADGWTPTELVDERGW